MAGGKDWSTLPSVIIVEILSYLSFDDILKSSSVCKSWRSCLFHPNLWHIVFFSLDTKGISRAKFLAENCGRFIREATVKFDSKKSLEVKDCIELLNIFSRNKNLEQFSLRPSNCHILWSEKEGKAAIDKILDHIEEIIKNSRKLSHFSLGCVEELSSHSSSLVQQLVKYHSKNLTSLHLPTVKEDGWGITDEDIIAMSRLRGESLHKFVIPMSCIFSAMNLEDEHGNDDDDENSDDLSVHSISQEFFDKVSKSLKRTWWPVEDTDLPLGLFDANADSEEIYMDTLLDDQLSS
ncbi:hypothetical protein LOTGIDRAFT_174082 [Lottia gigantea]|uniref:F-box domain-containing protein n=1 Tax=Lottia gigantea TaxID=225164 RepID=V4A426_LOTGI|nr:hypothetical protein LOTGIDRAFT_174082 [Lottia gigantea]ESO98668.1 hypothetical protein LOTGIDRAFT_174082 [Lottia gigantea]